MGTAPDWIPVPPVVEGPLARPLAPSRPDDVALGPQPAVRSPLEIARAGMGGQSAGTRRMNALRRGQMVHALLQYLPDCMPAERAQVARRWLSRRGSGLSTADCARIADQVMAVMETPAMVPLFASNSRAEQPLAGVVGDTVVVGQVDRMAVTDDEVLLCDFKTNRQPPARVEDTPVLYLRQMASYRALLCMLYPGRRVTCILVWTEGVRVSVLPDALVAANAPARIAAQ
ncbi:hypothetical protein BGC30_12340 [Novacetimonas hansenii]|nr:hypothetical protein BGC30_12340 [Novacetimonas hansenii]